MHKISKHALRKAQTLGINEAQLAAAANEPQVRYPSGGRYPGQWRHIRNGVVAVISQDLHTVVTCYVNVEETPVRPDQMNDPHARRYARRSRCQTSALR